VTRTPTEDLLEGFRRAAADGTLVKATLSAPRAAGADLRQMQLRPVALRAGRRIACVWRHRRSDVTKNLEVDAAVELLRHALASEFRRADLFTTAATLHYEEHPGRASSLRQLPARHAAPPSLAHDRTKRRVLPRAASPWLVDLGVTTAENAVRKGMEGKLRQIERFVEILAQHFPEELRRKDRDLRVVDLGAGKGYLTFATAAWLRQEGLAAEVIGVEARPELVEQGNAVAQAHGFAHLRFTAGTIADSRIDAADVVLALHACDTATDDALALAVAAGAALVLASPCCHQELRPKLAPPPGLEPVLRHGILRERQAELVTDALRAALLGAAGYATSVFEFVASEHSAKNLLLVGILRPGVDRGAAARGARALARSFAIRDQRLAARLGCEL